MLFVRQRCPHRASAGVAALLSKTFYHFTVFSSFLFFECTFYVFYFIILLGSLACVLALAWRRGEKRAHHLITQTHKNILLPAIIILSFIWLFPNLSFPVIMDCFCLSRLVPKMKCVVFFFVTISKKYPSSLSVNYNVL